MLCAVTVRSIKPGSFEDFRREWEPSPWPPELSRVVISLGAEESRLARIAQYEEALVFKGIFEVVEELSAPA
jgi:hypothetical protein